MNNKILTDIDSLIYATEGMSDILQGIKSELKSNPLKKIKTPSKQSIVDTIHIIKTNPGHSADIAAHAVGTLINGGLLFPGANIAAKTISTAEGTRKALHQKPTTFYTNIARRTPAAIKIAYDNPLTSYHLGKHIVKQTKDELAQTILPISPSLNDYSDYIKKRPSRVGLLASFRNGLNQRSLTSLPSNNLLALGSSHL